jgi:cytochrome c oxidase subunit 2
MVRLERLLKRHSAWRAGAVLALVLVGTAAFAVAGWAAQPTPWEIGMQPPATPIKDYMTWFNDELTVIIFAITAFVLGLLLYVIVRFDARRHPVPTKTSHNAIIEILWTIVPVLILVAIAVPSFKLLYFMARIPKAAMTIDVTGHQWYWTYGYPEQKISFDSNIVPDKDLKPGQLRLLTVDNPLVVPANTNVRVVITSTDVIHSWFIPSFGVQEYAIIGRHNETWFNVERPGTYYGECNQVCGVNHAFMPIEVVALPKADYEKWLVDAKKKFSADAAPAATPAPAATLVANAREAPPARLDRPAGN